MSSSRRTALPIPFDYVQHLQPRHYSSSAARAERKPIFNLACPETKRTRTPFSATDVQLLVDWMQPYSERHRHHKGLVPFLFIHHLYPHHTPWSWHDKWTKEICRTNMRPVTHRNLAAVMRAAAETARDSGREESTVAELIHPSIPHMEDPFSESEDAASLVDRDWELYDIHEDAQDTVGSDVGGSEDTGAEEETSPAPRTAPGRQINIHRHSTDSTTPPPRPVLNARSVFQRTRSHATTQHQSSRPPDLPDGFPAPEWEILQPRLSVTRCARLWQAGFTSLEWQKLMDEDPYAYEDWRHFRGDGFSRKEWLSARRDDLEHGDWVILQSDEFTRGLLQTSNAELLWEDISTKYTQHDAKRWRHLFRVYVLPRRPERTELDRKLALSSPGSQKAFRAPSMPRTHPSSSDASSIASWFTERSAVRSRDLLESPLHSPRLKPKRKRDSTVNDDGPPRIRQSGLGKEGREDRSRQHSRTIPWTSTPANAERSRD